LTDGLAQGVAARSESTWVCATQPLAGSIEAYAAHVPRRADPPHPPVGWSTWDYYYCGVGAEDVFENVAEIERDPVLRRHLTHVQIDMGWEHRFGEWQANHRFPGGMEALATGLRERGFVPGIWTAPVLIDPLSRPGLRDAQLLLKDAHGDPLRHADGYLLDPTHPAGRSLVEEVYTRLYRAGFRYFKVDFVDALVEAPRFHDPTKGPYDVLRDLFALIRSCVGQESRILGCSLPAATGPWVADYGRTGVDIHNQWTHVEWAADFLQLTFWLHHRIWVNDPDYLVVRGGATSREAVTTVLNPTEHQPNPPRWRRGPTFATVEEARAWGSLVALSGGSMFLGDRLAMLNEAGRSLLPPLLQPTGVAARPLDLGDGPRASLWLQELPREWRLGVVNWSGEPTTKRVVFGAYGLPAPSAVTDIWTGSVIPVRDGGCEVPLAARDAAVLVWDRESPADRAATPGAVGAGHRPYREPGVVRG
jgi:alpha-galactosidase